MELTLTRKKTNPPINKAIIARFSSAHTDAKILKPLMCITKTPLLYLKSELDKVIYLYHFIKMNVIRVARTIIFKKLSAKVLALS